MVESNKGKLLELIEKKKKWIKGGGDEKIKRQIFRIFASLSPNYGRKSHGYGEISILLWGELPTNT